MKVALVYDRVNKWGGAERVLLTLHGMFPGAPLYTSVYSPQTAPWAKVFDIKTSFLQKLPPVLRRHEWLAPLMPIAFEQFNFDEYDLVISVTSEATKGIITKPKTLHICYCLTPTRYLWSGYDDYFKDGWLRTLSKPIINYLRAWDKVAAQRPDYYIAISKEVQKRIREYYGRESEVVYPPVTLVRGPGGRFPRPMSSVDRLPAGTRRGSPTPATPHSFFLIVSRLVPYKRIDIVVEAFNRLGWPLKVVGTGVELKKLKSMARHNIEFLQNLTDSQLVGYYQECTALLVPGVEDFGLSIIEAQAAGRPVVAFGRGGALENIIAGRTGEFFEPQTVKALVKILKDFNDKDYRKEDCIKNAQRFSEERFIKELNSYIAKWLHN